MSYTTFEFGQPEVQLASNSLTQGALQAELERTQYYPHRAPTVATVTVTVKNTGDRAGAETVMLYTMPPAEAAHLTPPHRALRRYEKVALQAGETRSVTLALNAHDLALMDADGAPTAVTGTWTLDISGVKTAEVTIE